MSFIDAVNQQIKANVTQEDVRKEADKHLRKLALGKDELVGETIAAVHDNHCESLTFVMKSGRIFTVEADHQYEETRLDINTLDFHDAKKFGLVPDEMIERMEKASKAAAEHCARVNLASAVKVLGVEKTKALLESE